MASRGCSLFVLLVRLGCRVEMGGNEGSSRRMACIKGFIDMIRDGCVMHE